jgi:hypothetical protein
LKSLASETADDGASFLRAAQGYRLAYSVC